MAYSVRHPDVVGFGSSLISSALSPPQRAVRGAETMLSNLWSNYIALLGTSAENEELKSRLVALESENFRLKEVEQENIRLRNLLAITADHKLKGLVARVIGYDASNWVQAVAIDHGSSAGVKAGLAVMAGTGLVGQVISVSDSTARVLLLSDHMSGVDVVVQDSRVRGVVGGSGQSSSDLMLDCRYISREDEINVGDRLISSGVDGVFPPGILVGVVAHIDKRRHGLFQSVSVAPAVSFRKLEEVFIVTSWQGQTILEKRAKGSEEQ